MRTIALLSLLLPLTVALTSATSLNGLQKRDEDGTFSCYTLTNIWDFSALCPNINYPITNDRGLSTMGTLYFALASTSIPDDTIYNAQENIICTVNGPTQNITATVGAGVGGDIVNAGAEVSFTMSLPNLDGNSICMFTEGTGDDDKNVTDPITLAQARTLLYTMLTAPDIDCKTCGRIPIRYPMVQDGTAPGGGVLKIDVKSANNCLGKCVGPASFSVASLSPSPSTSQSAGIHNWPLENASSGMKMMIIVAMSWLFGVVTFNWALL